jgi:hypothetical protein
VPQLLVQNSFLKNKIKQQKERPKNLHRPNGLQSRRDCNQPKKLIANSAAKLARCFSSNMYKPAANGKKARSPEAKQQARAEAALRLDENDDRMKYSSRIRASFLFLHRCETG